MRERRTQTDCSSLGCQALPKVARVQSESGNNRRNPTHPSAGSSPALVLHNGNTVQPAPSAAAAKATVAWLPLAPKVKGTNQIPPGVLMLTQIVDPASAPSIRKKPYGGEGLQVTMLVPGGRLQSPAPTTAAITPSRDASIEWALHIPSSPADKKAVVSNLDGSSSDLDKQYKEGTYQGASGLAGDETGRLGANEAEAEEDSSLNEKDDDEEEEERGALRGDAGRAAGTSKTVAAPPRSPVPRPANGRPPAGARPRASDRRRGWWEERCLSTLRRLRRE